MAYYLGLDIGTTTISILCLDSSGKQVRTSCTRSNDSALPQQGQQDPARILSICRAMLDELSRDPEPCLGIGITCQMHGILYLDRKGCAVSPLYTWENPLGNEQIDGESVCRWMSRETGFPLATGYGLATHGYLTRRGAVPTQAVCLCTIGDYIGMQLCRRTMPLIHPSNAASLGLFHVDRLCFSHDSMVQLGLDPSILPPVSEGECLLGTTQEGIPVSIAIGDNQASYLGACHVPGDILLNFGTGSQLSVACSDFTPLPGLELRPFLRGQYLLSGSCLCGGSAYAALNHLFRCVPGSPSEDALYSWMEAEGRRALHDPTPLVDTRFSGTRSDPEQTGSIRDLTLRHLTPGSLVNGVLQGMCRELYDFFCLLPHDLRQNDHIVVSGNGARHNRLLRDHAQAVFSLPVRLAQIPEEAAAGAAKFVASLIQ